MPKYQVTAVVNVSFILDTTELEDDFAATKDELVDKLDPNDESAVLEYVQNLDSQDIFTQFSADDDIDGVKVELLKK